MKKRIKNKYVSDASECTKNNIRVGLNKKIEREREREQ